MDTFTISAELFYKAVRKLKQSYSPGPDGIPSIIFKRCADALMYPLCHIFNASLTCCKFPDIWKRSFMFPVFKKGDKNDVKNYRGITNLSAASKVFELIVNDYLAFYTKHYISSNQHGFVAGRSTCSNLIDFTSTCINYMENKMQVDVIYTDLKAAFDRIDHGILIKKLTRLGASERLTKWMKSYLCERTLQVKLGTTVSAPFSNGSGVPQGSNLGPLLFLLFFNDAILSLDTGCTLAYADDLKLFYPIRCLNDCYYLQSLLNTFVDWCRKNKLTVSPNKCMVMSFYRKKVALNFDYRISDIVLSRVEKVNDLGVMLDRKMTFTLHYSAVISNATRQLGFIARIGRDFRDPHCLKALYCALVRPILEYASPVWAPHCVSWQLRIERVQRRFIRLALKDLPWRDPFNLPPYADRCRLLGLNTLHSRRRIQQAVTIAKIINGEIMSPNLLSSLQFRTSRISRHSSLLQHSFHRTSYGQNEPLNACVRAFNKVEEFFEFNKPASTFASKITSINF